ncbi:TM2 domain-containing protein [Candidatus Woesearchaeota archaeon]|nr:TM2 domain-containing protein [Candidatus Woesearchaeota archaeon]
MAKRKAKTKKAAKTTKKKATKKKTVKKAAVKAAPTISVAKGPKVREVNWVLCLVMSVLFGWLGVDRFLMGQIGWGILKLITLGGFGIWQLIDIILIAIKHPFKGVKWV